MGTIERERERGYGPYRDRERMGTIERERGWG